MSKTKAIANDIRWNIKTQKVIFSVILGSLLTLFVVYVCIIGSITFNVIARKSLEKTVLALGNNISQLELTYLSSMNDVNKTRAMALGFTDTKTNIFASRSITHVAIR